MLRIISSYDPRRADTSSASPSGGHGRPLGAWSLATVALLLAMLVGPSSALASSEWSAPAEIDPTFFATSLSCPSSSFCVAGSRETAPAVYQGGSWGSASGSPLGGVSCVSATFCVGVVENDATVFNGTTWSAPVKVTASSGFPYLEGVSCVSKSFCIAVDDHSNAYKFNGTTWSTAGSVAGGEIFSQYAISCASETFCAATDNQATSIYDGTTWTQQKVLSTGELDAITCLSERFCVAGGTSEVRYNGTTWSTPAEIDGEERITGIACESTSTCVAVATVATP